MEHFLESETIIVGECFLSHFCQKLEKSIILTDPVYVTKCDLPSQLKSNYSHVPKTYWQPTEIHFRRQLILTSSRRIGLAMNGSFANATNVTLESFGRLSFDYASLIITVVYLAPMLLFNNLLVVVTAMEKSIVGTLRILLVNIVTAGQIVTVGMIMAHTANVIIIGHCCPKLRPSDFACRLMY